MKTSKLEDKNFDYKEKIDESFGKTICAYANTDGGKIIIGITKKGKVVGTTQKEEEKATNIMENCKPPVRFSSKWEKMEGKDVLVVEIPKSSKTHTWKGIAYKRSGSSSMPMDVNEIVELIRKRGDIRFDEEICKGASLEEIDPEKVRWFLRTAKVKRDYPIDDSTPSEDVLMHLNLSQNEKLTNAAVLLFGKNPQRFHLQAETKCIHFHGTEIEKPFGNYHIYKGNIFDQVDNALGFVLDRLKRPVIPEAGKATTKRPYEIPEFVVREAIVNAVAHRDYYSTGGVQIMVFSDRIEIWNPGELPPQLTLESLRKSHPSIPRNSLIAEVFYLTNYIEKAGSGTLEMIKQCRDTGLLEPMFEQKTGCFVTTIWRSLLTDEYLDSLGLNERQKKAAKYIEKYGRITRAKYEKNYGVSERTANRELSDLVHRKIIEKKEKGPETHYVLARFGEIWRDIMKKRGTP